MKPWLRHLPPVLGVALLAGAIWVVQNEFRNLKLADIKAALAAIPATQLWVALGWTLLAYALLTIYDRLGTIYAGRAVSYGRAAFASFCAYTLAHNLGFAAVSGAAVRYRLYAHWGLTPLQIGKVVAFCSLTFLLGGLVLGGVVLLVEPQVLPVLGSRLPRWVMHGIAAALLATATAYIVLSGVIGRIRVFGHDVELPSWRMAIAQTMLATVDVAVTAAIFHALLPPAEGLTFIAFLGIYLASYTAGLAANLPGGIGVFDTAMLLGLSPFLEPPVIVGAVVVFRLYYYIVPLFLAGGLFAGNEVLLRGRGVMAGTAKLRGVQTIGRWSQPDFAVAAAVGAVALCGALLLALGAIDALGDYAWITPDWHLPAWLAPAWLAAVFNPAGSFVPSLIGAALVVLSIALTRRVTLAWGLTIALLLAGAAVTAARGAHLWIPALLLAAAALLAPFRRLFYRHARLLSGKLDASRATAPLLLVGSVLLLATYEPRLVLLAHESWWQLVLSPALPNVVRISVALSVLVGLIAIWGLVRPGRVIAHAWDGDGRERYRALGATPPARADGLIWGEAGRAAIPFRRVGRVVLGFGDPAGAVADRVSAIWRLRDLATQEGMTPAIWRAGPTLLAVYADIGLAALPLDDAGLPRADAEDAPAPHATSFLACAAERDLPDLLPLLPELAAQNAGPRAEPPA
ncbi:MAG: lysylphosphatidylglycerol synthetase family protein [Acetobacteraceae bacterium]|nr:lysylphosphatidylglycerol synthetase family protein [Acetobacteraceae bacterium]